jgi:1-acyl-sn-glycerol-3-phosphate acyltransferase
MIIAARHESAYETILLMALLPTMVPIVKRELLWIPIYGWTIWKMGVIAIPRTKKVTALRSIQQQVQQLHGTPIVIFPEGTRMPMGVAGRIQSGIVAVYEASGLPVQPVAVQSGHVWPKRGLMQAGIVTLTLQPIIPAGLPRAELLATLAKSIAP